jgi:alpha-glucosidase
MSGTDKDWWRGGVIYQIYPRSFADANGDGIGDLKGITAHLDHVASLGADGIWLSPFFKSPMDDFGYDVADYCDVDPMFGTLADFDALIARAHALGLKVMIDQVFSHSAAQHPWFVESRASRTNPKADWYVWADARPDGSPPNNWLSLFGGCAWQWDTRRRQYYLHNFLVSQPDLNLHNAQVQQAVLDALEFWLKRGVDGVRLDVVNFFFHDRQLRDNPARPAGSERDTAIPDANPYSMQLHRYDKTQPENLPFLQRLRAVLDRYGATTSVGEIGDDDSLSVMAQYTSGGDKLHMAYSFQLLSDKHGAAYVRRVIEEAQARLQDGWPCWSLNNHDVPRVVTRWGGEAARAPFAKLMMAMLLSLRGSVCLYQGEELGLPEADVSFERLQDPYGKQFWPEFKGRDGCRTPMPWSATAPHAGFGSAEPWLPVSAAQVPLAVDVQKAQPDSVLAAYRTFLHWRKTQPALVKGSLALHDATGEVLMFDRAHQGRRMLCAFNLGGTTAAVRVPSGVTALQGHGFGGRLSGDVVTLSAYDAFFGALPASAA